MKLEALTENVSEVGEALTIHAQFNKDTLFLRGDKSEYIPNSDERLIKTHFPEALINTVSNAGHWLHAENPQEFYNYTMDFINS